MSDLDKMLFGAGVFGLAFLIYIICLFVRDKIIDHKRHKEYMKDYPQRMRKYEVDIDPITAAAATQVVNSE